MNIKQAQERALSAENALAAENRFQERIADLLYSLRGEQSVEQLLHNINLFLRNCLPLLFNVFYFLGEDGVDIIGSFALDQDQLERRQQQLSTDQYIYDLMTQQQVMRMSELDEHSFHVHSSVGDFLPREIIFLPMSYQEKIVGLLEIGFTNKLSDEEFRFINEANDILASQLSAAYSRQHLKKLLETIQLQEEELRQHTEELRLSNEDLTIKLSTIDEQNRQIVKQKSQLEQQMEELHLANRYKSEFLANMSHELRTPLNSLLLLANGLNKNREGNLTCAQLEDIAIINKSGHNLLNLINDILDLAKVEAGKLNIKKIPVTVTTIVDNIQQQFASIAKNRNIVFSINNDCQLTQSLYTDPLRLEQILTNLLSNAFKFTEKGEVNLHIIATDNDVLFTVTDSGIGIPNEQQATIFDAFKQVDGSSSRHHNGTGLGLNIAKNIATLLGGSLLLTESQLNKGSVFSLSIPRTTNKTITTDESLPSTIGSKQENTLLIIEDDMVFANYLKNLAHANGFQAVITPSGQQGFKLAKQIKPLGIILDLVLNDIDGDVVLTQLKTNVCTKSIPVHIITTKDADENLIRQGALCVLTKPVSDDQLIELFNSYQQRNKQHLNRILLIDDDENTRHALSRLLAAMNVSIDAAASGHEAISKYRQHHHDCLIVDYCLPDMTGLDLLRQLFNTDKTTTTNYPMVIVYTGQQLSTDTYRELNAYTEHFICKGPQASQRILDEMSFFLHSVTTSLQTQDKAVMGRVDQLVTTTKKATLLIVDDDLRNCFALSSELQREGYDTIIADSGKFALEKLASHSNDIKAILMDIMMPDMDGYQTMQAIRQQTGYQDIPIIALTAKAMTQDRQQCLAAGANDYLSKPIDLDKLLDLLQIWIKQ